MPRDPEKYRNIPYRPPREKYKAGNIWYLSSRFANDFCHGYKALLLLCIFLQIAAGFNIFTLTITARHMVNNVLKLESSAQKEASETSTVYDAVSPELRTTAETQDELLAKGIGTYDVLVSFFILFCIVIIFFNICGRIANRISTSTSVHVCGRLRERLHRKILRMDFELYQDQSPGRLMSYIISDVTNLQELLLESVILAIVEFVVISTGIGLLFYLNWQLAIIGVALLPLHAYLFIKIKVPLRESSRESRHTNSCLWNFTTQSINGIKTITAYAQEFKEYRHFFKLGSCFLRDSVAQQRFRAIINANAFLIQGLGTGAVYIVASLYVLKGSMSLGDMVMFFGVVGFLFGRIIQISQLNNRFAQIGVVLNRLFRIMDREVKITDKPNAKDREQPVQGKITVRGLSFHYPDSEQGVLDKVDMDVKAGEWICIMGASGSGKTTLVNMITRLYDAQEGQIQIDQMDLLDIKLDSIRKNIVLVPQSPQIFSGSIADNICYGSGRFSPSQIMAAAKAADLHETIMELPAKYETLLGEKGISLSGGQRQRLSLARALIMNPKILVLDDCTSALDAKTEEKIQDTLSLIMKDRTAIIVSQRVSMSMRCDKILVLEKGKVLEYGTHEELLANDKFYSQLYNYQVGTGDDE